MQYDPYLINDRHQERLREADRERLAAQVPHTGPDVRHTLALACHRVADWLEGATVAEQYFRQAQSGPGYWVVRTLRQ